LQKLMYCICPLTNVTVNIGDLQAGRRCASTCVLWAINNFSVLHGGRNTKHHTTLNAYLFWVKSKKVIYSSSQSKNGISLTVKLMR
jgi:hypothetical protein